MNVIQKQKEMLLDIMSKNLDIVWGSVAKLSEPYRTGKNTICYFIALVLDCT